jgi:hypothetical protein
MSKGYSQQMLNEDSMRKELERRRKKINVIKQEIKVLKKEQKSSEEKK